jgi:hypothetical protein
MRPVGINEVAAEFDRGRMYTNTEMMRRRIVWRACAYPLILFANFLLFMLRTFCHITLWLNDFSMD